MKTFVVVLAAVCFVSAFGALTPEDQTKLATVKESCIKSSAVEPAKVLAAKEGKWEESDMNLRKFASCFLTELGMMKGGSLDVEVTRTKIAKVVAADKIDEIMNKCKDMKGADADETALKLLKCYTDNRAVAA